MNTLLVLCWLTFVVFNLRDRSMCNIITTLSSFAYRHQHYHPFAHHHDVFWLRCQQCVWCTAIIVITLWMVAENKQNYWWYNNWDYHLYSKCQYVTVGKYPAKKIRTKMSILLLAGYVRIFMHATAEQIK